MRRLVLIAVAALALMLPGTAGASSGWWHPPPKTDETRLTAYLDIARAAWPDSPCNGQESVHLHANAELATFDVGDAMHSAARAKASTCEVWISDALPARRFCVVLVHEFGHLAGYEHGNGGVMDPDPVGFGPCDRLTLPMPETREMLVWDDLPVRTEDLATIYCGSRSCIVWTPGYRTRRYRIGHDEIHGPQFLPMRQLSTAFRSGR